MITLWPGVVLPNHIAQVGAVNVRVNLGSGDVGMAKQFLHHTKVSPAHEHVRGEAVPQHVRMSVREPSQFGQTAHDLPDGDALQRPTGVGKEQPLFIATVSKVREIAGGG
jgi:hypothetical protein